MSEAAAKEEADMVCCANCGKAEIDDVKLSDCPGGCDLTRYCSGDDCQQNHLEAHEATCKERAAEMRDEILFRQPESSHWGDCPICCLPLPLDHSKFGLNSCCGKIICRGCSFANKRREIEGRLKHKCPFCRKRMPETQEEAEKYYEKRVEANDPLALRQIGVLKSEEEDDDSAFEYCTRAATLGDAMAHWNLSIMYRDGKGVEKDEKMEIYHLEEAAIGGHADARFILGCNDFKKHKRVDRAVKHWIIAANLGQDEALHNLKVCYKMGDVSKDDLAAALRAHQAAVDATKSPQREAAAKELF